MLKYLFKITVLFIVIVTGYGCKRDILNITSKKIDNDFKTQSVIKNWLINETNTKRNTENSFISSLAALSEWSKSFAHNVESNDFYYVPLKSQPNTQIMLRFALNSQKNNVDSGDVLLIKNLSTENLSEKAYRSSFNSDDFTGYIATYTLNNVFKHVETYFKGKLISTSKRIKRGRSESIKIRTNSIALNSTECWDTYWVTIKSDGTQEWNYMYTTCGTDCTTTSILDLNKSISIQINCGGGGGETSPTGEEILWTQEMLDYQIDYKAKMSQAEIDIYDTELNSTQKLKYLLNAKAALAKAESLYSTSTWNGKGDAFRHAYFIALNAESLGPELAKRLAAAHEVTLPNSSTSHLLEVEMDTKNNAIGIQVHNNMVIQGQAGEFYRVGLQLVLMQMIESGGLWIISPLQSNGAPIDGVSKLVNSNL